MTKSREKKKEIVVTEQLNDELIKQFITVGIGRYLATCQPIADLG